MDVEEVLFAFLLLEALWTATARRPQQPSFGFRCESQQVAAFLRSLSLLAAALRSKKTSAVFQDSSWRMMASKLLTQLQQMNKRLGK